MKGSAKKGGAMMGMGYYRGVGATKGYTEGGKKMKKRNAMNYAFKHKRYTKNYRMYKGGYGKGKLGKGKGKGGSSPGSGRLSKRTAHTVGSCRRHSEGPVSPRNEKEETVSFRRG